MNINLSKWKLSHAGLTLVMVPLLFQIAAVGTLLRLLDQAEMERQHELHAKRVMVLLDDTTRHLNFLTVSYFTGIFLPFPGQEKLTDARVRQRYISNLRRIISDLNATECDDPKEKMLITQLCNSIDDSIKTFDAMRHAEVLEMEKIARKARQLSIDINKTGEELADYELAMVSLSKSRADARVTLYAILCASFVIAVILALTFAKLVANRLARISDNTRRLAMNIPLNPALQGTDEIANLDRVFHEMARELDEANRKERALTDNARDVICSLNDELRFIKTNPAAHAVWGFSPESLVGRSIFDLMEVSSQDELKRQIKELHRGQRDSIDCETELVTSSQKKQFALWSINYSVNDKSYFCVAHDITARKELEQMKDQFLSIVSHDLRSPLTSILGTMDVLIAGTLGDLPKRAVDKLRQSKRSVGRLTSLINNLLDIERLKSGQMPITQENHTLDSIIEESIEAVQGMADTEGIELEAEGTKLTAYCDKEKIVQVLVNLLSNAIKCSPSGQVVSVSAVTVDEMVELQVKDNGKGIAAQFHQIIFERFKQVETRDARAGAGTGLGLAICKSIIEQHGGTIGVISEEGAGSTFWFRIPGSVSDQPGRPKSTA